jgi:hypothetical protein
MPIPFSLFFFLFWFENKSKKEKSKKERKEDKRIKDKAMENFP